MAHDVSDMDFLGEFAARTGIEILRASKECVSARVPIVGNRQPFMLLHGGMSAALAEHIASVLAYMNAPEGKMAVGSHLEISHVRSGKVMPSGDNFVYGDARLIHCGSRTALVNVDIYQMRESTNESSFELTESTAHANEGTLHTNESDDRRLLSTARVGLLFVPLTDTYK